MKILVIDDEKWLLENLVAILELEGYQVLAAEDGLAGLRLARENLPDLIICDIMMPLLDGYGVLQELQNQLHTAQIPFIFLTAKTDRSDRRQGMELGADDFLTKPIAEHELLAAIQARLEKRQKLDLQQCQNFAAQLVQWQRQQEHELAQQLEQSFYQKLQDVNMMLQLVQDLPFSDSLWARFSQSIRELAQNALRKSQELHPHLLANVGLAEMLEWYLKGLKLETQISIQAEQPRLAPEAEEALYQVLRQASNLADQHLSLNLWQDQDRLHLEIELDYDKTQTSFSNFLMQEYTRLGKGEINIQWDEDLHIHLIFEHLPAKSPKAAPPLHLEQVLTQREIEIMLLILQDQTHSDIAETLVISHRTVEKHRANLMQKLGLKTHTELILFAVRHGIITG